MYAYTPDGQTVTAPVALPTNAVKLGSDPIEYVTGLASASADNLALCGYYLVVETTRPADDATTTYDLSYVYDSGTVTQTWTARAKTQAELDADTQAANQSLIETAMDAALAQLTTYINASPPTFTNLASAQTWARQFQTAFQQVCVYQRQEIRYLRGDFDGST